ncbi:MAG: hypothetical protein AABY09_03450 [Nanoarchaeota archaeon]
MEHLAILSKQKKLLAKIISGEKTIESRWYASKKAPFGLIAEGDTIYFKESGEPVTVKAKASRILYYEGLNQEKIKGLLIEYGSQIGVDVSYLGNIKDKKFCILIFLDGIEKIEQFRIDKKGYGMMCAWISVDSIDRLKA